jgi:hypothetical protein
MIMVERSSLLSRFTLGLVAALVTTVAVLPDAEAQAAKAPTAKQRQVARDAYNAGTTAYDKGDYAVALEHFKKANETIPSPHALYWVALSHDKLGHKEDAIKSFDELFAHPDVAKIGDDKLTTARNRAAELKAPPPVEPAPTPPAEEPAPTPPPEPPPEEPTDQGFEQQPVAPPPAAEDESELKHGGLFEFGLFTGPLFVSGSHNLHEERFTHSEYSSMAWLFGLRAGFLFHENVGLEVEYAHGWGSVEELPGPAVLGSGGTSADFNTFRGHVIGQVPVGRFIPFALLGIGDLQATSDRLGADGDFLLELGLGAKFAATKVVTPRLDVRFDMTQKEDGGFSDGIAVHPEVLLGLSITLGR